MFFLSTVKLMTRRILNLVASRARQYIVLFKIVEATSLKITRKNRILLLPIYKMLQVLINNLGISSSTEYLKVLINTNNNIRLSVREISKILPLPL